MLVLENNKKQLYERLHKHYNYQLQFCVDGTYGDTYYYEGEPYRRGFVVCRLVVSGKLNELFIPFDLKDTVNDVFESCKKVITSALSKP